MNKNFVQQGDIGLNRRHSMVKLLQVNNLKKHFHLGKNEILKAVDGVSFHINKGKPLELLVNQVVGSLQLEEPLSDSITKPKVKLFLMEKTFIL